MTGVYGHQTRPHNLRHMSIDIEKNIEFLFRNMEDEIKERNRKRAEIWALKSFRDRSDGHMEGTDVTIHMPFYFGKYRPVKYAGRYFSVEKERNKIWQKQRNKR